jgi:hypothetical protein
MNCCNDFGQCTNGKDCPARTRTTTPREDVEKLLGVWQSEQPATPARIGKRYHAAPSWAPSHWRKTLKLWATVALTFIGVFIIGGVAAGIIERVWP